MGLAGKIRFSGKVLGSGYPIGRFAVVGLLGVRSELILSSCH